MDLNNLLRDAEEGQWDFELLSRPAELRILVGQIVRDDLLQHVPRGESSLRRIDGHAAPF